MLGSTYNEVHSFDIAHSAWKYEETRNSEAATSRMSHTAVVHQGRMIVYGGMDLHHVHGDILSLDLTTMTWSVVICEGHHHPGSRRSHAAVMYKGKMYVTMGLPQHLPPDFWCFDFENNEWHPITTTQRFGVPPLSLHGHSTCVVGDQMFLFGGAVHMANGPCTYSNRLHAFDFITGVWSEVTTAGGIRPPPRYSHVMNVSGGVILVHGGDSENCTKYFDDLWSIDVSAARPRWVAHHRTGPQKPCARSGHCGASERGMLFVFGGEAPGDETTVFYSGDLYRFPMNLCVDLPLTDLCARWLGKVLRPSDISSINLLTPDARKALKSYLPLGKTEQLSPHQIV